MSDENHQSLATSVSEIRLDPLQLSFSLRSLSGLALLVAAALYMTIALRLFEIYAIFNADHAVMSALVVSLPLFVWFGLGGVNRLLVHEPKFTAQGEEVGGSSDLLRLIKARLKVDAAILGLKSTPRLLYGERGSPYTFRSFGEPIIVVSGEWLDYLRSNYKDPPRLERAAQAVLLHELGHIHSGDIWLIGLTDVLLYLSAMLMAVHVGLEGLGVAVRMSVVSFWLTLVAQLFLHRYIARRRETYADLFAARMQRSIHAIEVELTAFVGAPLMVGAHGFVGSSVLGFVSRRPSLRHRLMQAFLSLFAYHFDTATRVHHLRSSLGEFCRLRWTDFLVLGMAKTLFNFAVLESLRALGLFGTSMILVAGVTFATVSLLVFWIAASYSLATERSGRDFKRIPWALAAGNLLGLVLTGVAVALFAGPDALSFKHVYVLLVELFGLSFRFRYFLNLCLAAQHGATGAEFRSTVSWLSASLAVLEYVLFVTAILLVPDDLPLWAVVLGGGLLSILLTSIPERLFLRKRLDITHWTCGECKYDNELPRLRSLSMVAMVSTPIHDACGRCGILRLRDLLFVAKDPIDPVPEYDGAAP